MNDGYTRFLDRISTNKKARSDELTENKKQTAEKILFMAEQRRLYIEKKRTEKNENLVLGTELL